MLTFAQTFVLEFGFPIIEAKNEKTASDLKTLTFSLDQYQQTANDKLGF